MQGACLAVAARVYAAAVVRAVQGFAGPDARKVPRTAIFPGMFLGLSFLAALVAPPVRRFLERHLWLSYRTGFGQTPISVLGGLGVLLAVAGFIFWSVADGARGGRYPGGAFSGYAAGIGLLLAQTLIVRRMERDPEHRAEIETE